MGGGMNHWGHTRQGFAKLAFCARILNYFFYYLRRLNPRHCVLLKVFWCFSPHGGLWWEVALDVDWWLFSQKLIGDFGDSFCNVIACFIGNCNNHKVNWCLVHLLMGEVSFASVKSWWPYCFCNNFRRVRDVDMKHDFAFVVCFSSHTNLIYFS